MKVKTNRFKAEMMTSTKHQALLPNIRRREGRQGKGETKEKGQERQESSSSPFAKGQDSEVSADNIINHVSLY